MTKPNPGGYQKSQKINEHLRAQTISKSKCKTKNSKMRKRLRNQTFDF